MLLVQFVLFSAPHIIANNPMMLPSNPLLLGSTLSVLLAPPAAPDPMQTTPTHPRAVCLPAAAQQDLALAATSLLNNTCYSQHHTALRELLAVLANSNNSSAVNTSASTARWALQHQQQRSLPALLQQPVHSCSLQHMQPAAPAPLPSWLTPSTQHFCSWLSRPPAAPPAPATPAAAAKQPGSPSRAGGNEAAAAGGTVDAGGQLPAAKRPRLEGSGGGGVDGALSPKSAAQTPATPAAAVVDWDAALAQLQEFASAGDTSHLDFPGLCAVLAAAAAQHSQATRPEHAPMLQRLQQQLQNLSVDAFHVLLEELLLRANSTAAAINSSSGGAGGGGGGQVSDAGLAFLLSHALLPKLLTLSGAAPKSMLACLTALGRSPVQSCQDVLVDTLLGPLVLSERLLPVQVQLLTKLAKDVDSLQRRLLALLLAAAQGQQGAAAAAQYAGGGLPQLAQVAFCCWREPHAQLLKALFDTAPQLLAQHLSGVVSALDTAVQQQPQALAKSSVFGQVLMALLKKFPSTFSRQQVEQLQAVVGRTSTFMTKSLATKLQQLSEQHAAISGH